MTNPTDGKFDVILKAAIEVISEKGLDKSSISEIVKLAGVAQGTFYLYFKSKKDLIPAIADKLLAITLADVKVKTEQKETFWEKLDVLIDETFQTTNTHQDIIVLVYSGLAVHHSLEKWEAVYQPYYDWFEQVMREAIENEEIIDSIHVGWTARSLINMIENAAERYYIGYEQDEELAVYRAELFHFIKRSLERL
ncbi:TetR family transcriptional regulator [Ammoniphilus oxalaticus]|uniref:TetR family transcriptional regulator n=1 Tax=Ammoniphilus oxalaticus TaxID=66863 RepID=A0A419SNL8_9BACL|nr:TetR family transcriptional regulator [Ammoniphilus oxalaticus]RKD25875.1 TetR family transcriptional regulator [Ammoniphilus oxalaticus]